jgi:two-component system cell cycle sensor histidine kinase/response regulator CckA
VGYRHRRFPISSPAVDSPAARPVVLLVDDEPMIHVLASRTLARAGWDVLNALDGLQAIQILASLAHPPALVITDMRMPRMSGAELGQWIEVRYPTMPILLISGFMDSLPPLSPSGLRASLGKPFTPAMLLQTVREVCSAAAQLQH